MHVELVAVAAGVQQVRLTDVAGIIAEVVPDVRALPGGGRRGGQLPALLRPHPGGPWVRPRHALGDGIAEIKALVESGAVGDYTDGNTVTSRR
jgi:hypothetical protein